MKYHENKLFIILTKNKLISRLIEEDQRVSFFGTKENLFKSFAGWNFTETGQQSIIDECDNMLATTTKFSEDSPKDEIILDMPADEADGAISYVDHLANTFSKNCTINNVKELYDIKLITSKKVKSDWIPIEHQVALVDIENIEAMVLSENKNGISFIDSIENIEYLKDNIKTIIDSFVNSGLKTLDVYCLIKEEVDGLEGMKEETQTSFSYMFENRKLNIFTYPSTNIGATIAEIE